MIPEFTDPRLVAIYDTVNSYAPDTQPGFYRELAAELRARSIVDLGCGTGIITCELAGLGYAMTGVEPSPAMLEVARARRFGDRVRWIEGDADAPASAGAGADLAIMSGHVAQFFLTDASWSNALTALHHTLRPGGALAFETRNPEARAWEHWTPDARVTVHDPVAGAVETWTEVDEVADEIVAFTNHYAFVETGEELASPARLRFRTGVELTESLSGAGFTVDRLHGDWDRRQPGPTAPELIVVATR